MIFGGKLGSVLRSKRQEGVANILWKLGLKWMSRVLASYTVTLKEDKEEILDCGLTLIRWLVR